jgi:photosystem II stability/assembly factor-like uncharacterized protein
MCKQTTFDARLIIGLFILSLPLQAQWVEKNNGLPNFNSSKAIDACSDDIAVINIDSGIFLTTNGGNQWQQITNPPGVTWLGSDIEMTDSLHIWICGHNGEIYATSDKGRNWTLQFTDTTLTTFINYVEMFDSNNGIAMGDGLEVFNGAAVILQTVDGGSHWVSMNDSSFGSISYNEWREVDFLNDGVGYYCPLVLDDCVWKTNDFGRSWTKTAYMPDSNPTVLKFYDKNIGFVSNGGAIARTMDGGNTWKYWDHENASPTLFTWLDIEFAPGDPSTVWLLGDNEVFFSSDTGNTWKSININGYGEHALNPGRDLVFTSRDNGWLLSQKKIYKTANGGGFTDVAQAGSRLPETFLFQNFPNPFNPETEIQFQIRKTSHATLKIHDVLGNEIATLLDDRMEAGTHTVLWNGRNRENFPVSSGIYLYRLIVDKEILQGKMTLIR